MSRGPSAFQLAAGLDEDGNYLDGTGEQEARWIVGLSWHERRRYETLKAEWERWRYRRSTLPAEERGPMMRIGERECRWCGGFFEPTTLRQRCCRPTCAKLDWKRRRRQEDLAHGRIRVTTPTPDADAADSVTPTVDSPPICEGCGEPITDARRSTKRYHGGRCRTAAYRRRRAD